MLPEIHRAAADDLTCHSHLSDSSKAVVSLNVINTPASDQLVSVRDILCN